MILEGREQIVILTGYGKCPTLCPVFRDHVWNHWICWKSEGGAHPPGRASAAGVSRIRFRRAGGRVRRRDRLAEIKNRNNKLEVQVGKLEGRLTLALAAFGATFLAALGLALLHFLR